MYPTKFKPLLLKWSLFWQTQSVTGNLFTLMLILKDWLVVQSLKWVGISCSTSWTIVYYDLKISDTSEALEVGRSTIKRRLKEYGISISERKTDITDTELDCVVRNIQRDFPNAAYRRMQSQLSLRGIKILFLRREFVHQCRGRSRKGWQWGGYLLPQGQCTVLVALWLYVT